MSGWESINITPPFKGQFSIINSRISFAGKNGVVLGQYGNPVIPSDILFQNNFIGGNSQNSSNSFHGIVGIGNDVVISGNIIGRDISSGPNSQFSGLQIMAGSSRILVTNNIFKGNITSTINNQGCNNCLINNNL